MGGSDARSERYDEAPADGGPGACTNETLRTMQNTCLHSSFGHAGSSAPCAGDGRARDVDHRDGKVTAERVALVLQGTVLGIDSSKGIIE